MKISTRTRYGARLMVVLGLHYGKAPVYLKNIAKEENISEKYLTQIIIPLKSAGLINSFRGAHGGYVLARHPDSISFKEIVETLEGGLNIVECVSSPDECRRISRCVTRDLWCNLGEVISETLQDTTVGDLAKRCREKKEKAVMYTI
ncbi:MAG: Rrf2 family transcriptional regulator [Candidatus Omnitrophica bacterium]|nr:Rrf2 family transcriptional regulator [Candidatus Omnitrophota bacterium]